MIQIELTPEEAEVLVRLFNVVTGMENVRAVIPIHDKLLAAAQLAGVPSVATEVVAKKQRNGARKEA